ncbi:MAG: HAMP domain-containing sensor histidine kinase [Anaerolineales bacterium]|jgi:signal transduction histidine kinase
MNLPEVDETLGVPASRIRNARDNLQLSHEQLLEYAAALQTRNEELEAYAHTVAHNLKNPLAVLVITSDLITDIPDLTRKELREYLEQIRSVAYEMDSIINNLLLLSQASQVDAPSEPLDMVHIVANIRKRLNHLIKARQARVSFPETWPTAIGYAPWVEEVWANYLSNALKYGGEPPIIELGATPQPDGMIRFWIRDHGFGIPPDAQKRLFTPFTQLGRNHEGGHGLGLAIVLHIVEKLGGQVGVESEMGQGSLFFFTLPVSPITL